MSHNILLTGASGYLGGDLLARISKSNLPNYKKLYALVRQDHQADQVKKYGAEPIRIDVSDRNAIHKTVISNNITIVLWMINVMSSVSQAYFIEALTEVKKTTGLEVHLVHTTGAKIFSSHAGAPTDRELLDDEDDLYEIQKTQRAPVTAIQPAIETNTKIIDLCAELGVHSYLFAPCIVYGKGKQFGNPISIQTKAIIQAGMACKRVYNVDQNQPTWPVCHISDNSSLYLLILRKILSGEKPPSGRQGFYLASPGSVAWLDIYRAIARELFKRGLVQDDEVPLASDADRARMAEALGCPASLVGLQLGGYCTFTARNGKKLGWQPQYKPEHILETADEEVDRILNRIQ